MRPSTRRATAPHLTISKARRRSSSLHVSSQRGSSAMNLKSFRQVISACAVLTISLVAFTASADEPSKKMCVESHSKAQDAKEDGELTLARKLFMACAQPQCPGVVQSDCARFADEIERSLPSLSFAARDDKGNDLPDTTVYVDEKLVATSLTDGRPHE